MILRDPSENRNGCCGRYQRRIGPVAAETTVTSQDRAGDGRSGRYWRKIALVMAATAVGYRPRIGLVTTATTNADCPPRRMP